MKVCLLVEHRSQFPEMLRTALALGGAEGMSVSMLFAEPMESERLLAEQVGLAVINDGGMGTAHMNLATLVANPDNEKSTPLWLKRWFKSTAVYRWLRNQYIKYCVSLTSWVYLPYHVRTLRANLKRAAIIQRELAVDVLVVPFVNSLSLSGAMVVAARLADLPVVVVPYSWITRKESHAALVQFATYQIRGVGARVIQMMWPQWGHQGVLFLPPVKIIASWWVGLPMTVPWMMDAHADFIASESLAMRQSYVNDGVPVEKCVVTGSVSLDLLGNASSQRPAHLDADFFLVFVPADQTGNGMPSFEFDSYWEMVLFWVGCCLAVSGYCKPVFSIHPRMRGDVDARLKQIWPNINIHEGDACWLIPHAEFCVSELGGMMRYVLACSKPLLYYDAYKYGFGAKEFFNSGLLIRVSSRDSFQYALDQLAAPGYVEQIRLTDQTNESHWGQLDSGAAARIAGLLRHAVACKKAATRV